MQLIEPTTPPATTRQCNGLKDYLKNRKIPFEEFIQGNKVIIVIQAKRTWEVLPSNMKTWQTSLIA